MTTPLQLPASTHVHLHSCKGRPAPSRLPKTHTYLPALTCVYLHPYTRVPSCHPKLTHPPNLTHPHLHPSLHFLDTKTYSSPLFGTLVLAHQPACVSVYSPSTHPHVTYHPHSLSLSLSLCTTEKAGWLERQRYLWDYMIWSSNSRGIETTGGNMAWPWEGCSGMGRGSLEHEICGVSSKNQET